MVEVREDKGRKDEEGRHDQGRGDIYIYEARYKKVAGVAGTAVERTAVWTKEDI